MAEKQDETLLNNTLKHDEIPIAIELAVALRADEVDKFLELYDSIPKTVQTERVDKIKEMARQLAAFPKKQFDMYRPKPRGFVSGEHFTLSSSTLNAKDKLLSNHLNEVYSNKSEDLDLKDIIPDVPKNSVDADEMTVALTKSAKKKSKKKKKKVSTASDQASSICNGELKPTSEGEKDSEVVIENKFLDSDGSGSRVATMNKNMVADISVVSPSVSDSDATKKVSNSTVNHSSDHETKDCDFEENLLDSEGTENEDIKDPDTENNEELHYNSDSGVDVNSVGSCDSAIHSPKMPNEFDLEEAVNFFMKGLSLWQLATLNTTLEAALSHANKL
ncbi:hypothetical protein QZH41_004453 [Actinostola sp. cb2023]|nr:hypothetical protein QZH41_004453 [Actinostola sp. cb2023]